MNDFDRDQNHSYLCLQKDLTNEEKQIIRSNQSLNILVPKLGDFSDTAGLCMNLDFVVTVDTSIAHLAGSLGLQT